MSEFSYDQVPYPSHPLPQTHPDRLATIAHLFGLEPKPADRCRVLEIGCAGGGNLVPMAEQLPESCFVGIDLSRVQIDQAREFAEQAGLHNVEFRQLSVLDIDGSLGKFDYVLCHGVYSWVPDAVRDKILEVCSSNLEPHGVAYVSYNAYPGWHLRGMVHDLMTYYTSRFHDPEIRIQQARNLLQFMAQHAAQDSPHGMFLKYESERLGAQSDAYLFHEHLADCNSPTYFFQFVQRAAGKGLQYLAEADLSSMGSSNLLPEVAQALRTAAVDLVQMEQLVDFLRNRTFRQTLLCHQERTIDRQFRPAALESLRIASPLIPAEVNADLRSTGPLRFRHRASDRALTTRTPFVKASLVCLAEAWPAGLTFTQLMVQAAARIDAVPARREQDADELGHSLFDCNLSDLVEFRTASPRFTTKVENRPQASRVARAQAEAGHPAVTNLRHESGQHGDVILRVLRLLDGTRGRPALLEALHRLVEENMLVVQENGRPLSGRAAVRPQLEKMLDQALVYLASNALLLA